MTRDEAMPHVRYAVDNALCERRPTFPPAHARLIGWDDGEEPPTFIAVWSYLPGDRLTDVEAIELAVDLLSEKKWFGFSGETPRMPDYII